MHDKLTLLVLPSLRAICRADGTIVMTRKFIEGMEQYVSRWPGPVATVLEGTDVESNNLDNVAVRPEQLSFGVTVADFDSAAFRTLLTPDTVALCGGDHRQNHVVDWCRQSGATAVVCTEYSLRTRWQIAQTEERRWLKRWRRMAWEVNQERIRRTYLAQAAGVQCNGTPTFDAYAPLNQRTMLYFDTRTTREALIAPESLERRLNELVEGRPLRLAFSGRLIEMKGADHLPLIAAELRRMNVPFELTIYGDGALRERLRQHVIELGLADCVQLPGTLDFHRELLPRLRSECDLFVCPHRQGDPSCTYLETLACGVPIVGYANEAFAGILRRAEVGWSARLDDPRGVAQEVARLHQQRDELRRTSRAAIEFAAQHTFELEFQRRIEHLLLCAGVELPESQCELVTV